MPITSADRTRSRRYRSGTRRNKKKPIAHLPLCAEPNICRVHCRAPEHAPMRMLLTRCEQQWVDDVRSGRRHIHPKRLSRVSSNTPQARRVRSLQRLLQSLAPLFPVYAHHMVSLVITPVNTLQSALEQERHQAVKGMLNG